MLDRNGEPVSAGSAEDFHPDTRNFRRPNATEPWFQDWDDDGDLDLIIGSMEGEIVLARNEGTRTEPVYAERTELIMQGDRPIRLPGGEAAPECADWDGDGRWDLLAGSGNGAVFFFRNVGTATEPKFGEGVAIVPEPTGYENFLQNEQPTPGHTSRICVSDYNGDGKLDLLLGDVQGEARLPADADDETRARFVALRDELRTVHARNAAIGRERDDEMWQKGYRPVGIFPRYFESMKSAMAESAKLTEELRGLTGPASRHAYVWVFLRR